MTKWKVVHHNCLHMWTGLNKLEAYQHMEDVPFRSSYLKASKVVSVVVNIWALLKPLCCSSRVTISFFFWLVGGWNLLWLCVSLRACNEWILWVFSSPVLFCRLLKMTHLLSSSLCHTAKLQETFPNLIFDFHLFIYLDVCDRWSKIQDQERGTFRSYF